MIIPTNLQILFCFIVLSLVYFLYYFGTNKYFIIKEKMDVMGETALQELKGHQEPKVCVKYKRSNTKTTLEVGISYCDILKWEG